MSRTDRRIVPDVHQAHRTGDQRLVGLFEADRRPVGSEVGAHVMDIFEGGSEFEVVVCSSATRRADRRNCVPMMLVAITPLPFSVHSAMALSSASGSCRANRSKPSKSSTLHP
jgi:hypothetical protein